MLYIDISQCYNVILTLGHYKMAKKISLEKIRANRDTPNLKPRSYKFHPLVSAGLDKRALKEGTSKVALLERIIVEYLNKD